MVKATAKKKSLWTISLNHTVLSFRKFTCRPLRGRLSHFANRKIRMHGTKLFKYDLQSLMLQPHCLLGRRPVSILAHTIKSDFNLMKKLRNIIFQEANNSIRLSSYLQKHDVYSFYKVYLLQSRCKIKCAVLPCNEVLLLCCPLKPRAIKIRKWGCFSPPFMRRKT